MSTLPATIGNWSDVEGFGVLDNKLDGSLPVEIGMWSRLRLLSLTGNQFTGTLPNSIGQCSALEQVCALSQKRFIERLNEITN